MNYLVVCQSRLWIVTIVFYTCVLIPLQQLKRALATILFFSFATNDMEFLQIPSLPVARFHDLGTRPNGDVELTEEEEEEEEICSICLVEFVGEDAVTKLTRCGHVFHLNCIHQWLHRFQFSCPLCRSFLFPHHHHIHSNK